MQHNPIISGSSEGVCPSGNIRRILSKFPDICRRSHFCHDRKVSSIRQWQSFGLCMRKQHFPFFNSTVVNDTKCTVPLHGKKRHSQENVFWQFHLFYEMLLFYFVSGLIRMAFHTSLYEKRTRPMSLNSGIRFGTLPKIH